MPRAYRTKARVHVPPPNARELQPGYAKVTREETVKRITAGVVNALLAHEAAELGRGAHVVRSYNLRRAIAAIIDCVDDATPPPFAIDDVIEAERTDAAVSSTQVLPSTQPVLHMKHCSKTYKKAVTLVSELITAWCLDGYSWAHALDFHFGSGVEVRAHTANQIECYLPLCIPQNREELERIIMHTKTLAHEDNATNHAVLRCIPGTIESVDPAWIDTLRARASNEDIATRMADAAIACRDFVRAQLDQLDWDGPTLGTACTQQVVRRRELRNAQHYAVHATLSNCGSAVHILADLVFTAGEIDCQVAAKRAINDELFCGPWGQDEYGMALTWHTVSNIREGTDVDAIASAIASTTFLKRDTLESMPFACGALKRFPANKHGAPVLIP